VVVRGKIEDSYCDTGGNKENPYIKDIEEGTAILLIVLQK